VDVVPHVLLLRCANPELHTITMNAALGERIRQALEEQGSWSEAEPLIVNLTFPRIEFALSSVADPRFDSAAWDITRIVNAHPLALTMLCTHTDSPFRSVEERSHPQNKYVDAQARAMDAVENLVRRIGLRPVRYVRVSGNRVMLDPVVYHTGRTPLTQLQEAVA
jgi:hypothetical protein